MREKTRIITIRGHSFYTGLVNRDSVIVDLGAHKGEFSAEISDSLGCKCYAVEALPSLFSLIIEKPLIEKYNFAMAGRDEPVELFISKNLEGSTIAGFPAAGSDGAVTVNGVTLETFMARAGINAIDLLKIDIEGAEIGLFESTSDAALSNITQITVEFHDFLPNVVSTHQVEEVNKRLQDLGFYVIKFSRSLNTDVLFINRKRSGISRMEYLYLAYVVKYYRGIFRIFKNYFR